jgi:hypothetical protein
MTVDVANFEDHEMSKKTRPYRPSNGTEGMLFDDRWCSRCQRDAAWRENESGVPCVILSRTLIHSLGDAEYPIEWVQDDIPYSCDNLPLSTARCTAFVEIQPEDSTPDGSTYVADPRQKELEL